MCRQLVELEAVALAVLERSDASPIVLGDLRRELDACSFTSDPSKRQPLDPFLRHQDVEAQRRRFRGSGSRPSKTPRISEVRDLQVARAHKKGRCTIAEPSRLRPLRPRPLLLLAVHLEVHLLVEETQESSYLECLRYGLGVVPDEVLDSLPPRLDRIVGRDPLVGALRVLTACSEN